MRQGRPLCGVAARGAAAWARGALICYAFCGTSYDRVLCSPESEGFVFACLPRRGAAARASVDDAAGGAVFARIPGDSCEAWVFGGLQDTGIGSGGVAAAVPAAGRGRSNCVLGHINSGGGDGVVAAIGRCGAEFAGAGAVRVGCRATEGL